MGLPSEDCSHPLTLPAPAAWPQGLLGDYTAFGPASAYRYSSPACHHSQVRPGAQLRGPDVAGLRNVGKDLPDGLSVEDGRLVRVGMVGRGTCQGLNTGRGWSGEPLSRAPGYTRHLGGVPICLPCLHSGNPFAEKKGGPGQGSLECFLWLLPPFTLWGARAVPGLDVAMGTSDLVHGERSGGTGPGEAGPGGFCP